MTPLHIAMLLHYYVSTEPYSAHNYEHDNSTAVKEYRSHLISDGLTEPSNLNDGYKTTEKGVFYVEALCGLPLPVAKWVIPNEH